MAQLFVQFAITFVGMEVIKNNLMEIFLPSVLLCSCLSFVTLFYTCNCPAVHLVRPNAEWIPFLLISFFSFSFPSFSFSPSFVFFSFLCFIFCHFLHLKFVSLGSVRSPHNGVESRESRKCQEPPQWGRE